MTRPGPSTPARWLLGLALAGVLGLGPACVVDGDDDEPDVQEIEEEDDVDESEEDDDTDVDVDVEET